MSAANSLSSASVGPKLPRQSGSCCAGDGATVGSFLFSAAAPSRSSLQHGAAAAASSAGGGEQSSARARSKVGTRYSNCSSSDEA
uniref:Uncharacterized protein n=1 Tax=Arundo donax TaxID=35708 RepID=A0A0A9GHU8_ARUDO